MTILLLFFLSGVTALIYEVIWSKYLSLLFGSTIQAQTVVLAVFMGGLALGNKLFGKRADRAQHPLAIYGCLELAIGAWAFFFPSLYKAADWAFAVIGAKLLDHAGWLLSLKAVLSASLLLCPTVLMGGTLPVLAAWLQRNGTDAGRRSARFYSINTLGAVFGAGLAGFFLVTWVGLPETLELTSLVNLGIGLVAVLIAKHNSQRSPSVARWQTTPVNLQDEDVTPRYRWACFLVALTGAISMGLEVLASRCLSLVFGASLQSFAVVLIGFILGIGVGSAIVASPRTRHWSRETTTLTMLLGAAVWLGLVVYNIEGLVEFYRVARSGLGSNLIGYRYYQILAGLFSVLILGVPALALGAVLPLWIRVVSETSNFLGERVGRLLTWNTLGAVGGVLVTGFVLMPYVGLRGSFALLGFVLAGSALLMAGAARRYVGALTAAAVAAFLMLVTATGGEQWRLVLSSGVFRWKETEVIPFKVAQRLQLDKILFYEDAADATVSVQETGLAGARQTILKINGKADASSRGDLSTQLLLAHLPMMARGDAKDVFIFGLGSGISAGALLRYPVENVIVAENCEPVVRAAKFFEPGNNGVLTNPRVHIRREDARTVLKLSSQPYDVIVAEPSNPWTVGVGSVFSREFYQLCAGRLKPGGLMAQWFHLYDMDDAIVDTVVRTFSTVFPNMEIWDASGGDIIMMGSLQPWQCDVETLRKVLQLPEPAHDLARIGLTSPESILALQFASQRTAFAIAGPGPLQSDDFPQLEYAAPRAFYIGHRAQRLNVFDERTWQAGLTSAEKAAALASLDSSALKAIFNGIGSSVNPDLQSHLRIRCNQKLAAEFVPVGGGVSLPSVFAIANLSDLTPPPAATTNDVARALFDTEVAFNSGSANEIQAISEIEKILLATKSYDAASAGWSATYYGGLAIKASLRRNDTQTATRILQQALRLEPGSDVLLYLNRVITRSAAGHSGNLAFQAQR
jgi:predicted membrane-bound spermidine synthase